eukprot:scaffold43359_cov58-Attheya_sp.AAC.7
MGVVDFHCTSLETVRKSGVDITVVYIHNHQPKLRSTKNTIDVGQWSNLLYRTRRHGLNNLSHKINTRIYTVTSCENLRRLDQINDFSFLLSIRLWIGCGLEFVLPYWCSDMT